ncbi:MAG: hypothetical protein RR214_04670, partial [Synergistaceae bacterium]
ELRDMLRDNDIMWREDASNTDTVYRRNMVREELIPWIKKNMNPNFEETMVGFARQLDGDISDAEAAASQMLASVSVSIPPSVSAWNAELVKGIPQRLMVDMLRMEGERLNLPSLSRKRTLLLADLIHKGGFWRFQWARDIEVCYSNRGIGWLHRSDIESALHKNKQNTVQFQLPWWAR